MFVCRGKQITRILNKSTSIFLSKNVSMINRVNLQYVIIPVIQSSFLCNNPNLQLIRSKHKDAKKGKKPAVSDSEDEEAGESLDEDLVDKQTKLITVKVNSLRADVILKTGLGIARNKIENMFYESKIRVNGQKLLKKSAMLEIGDEIDIVRGSSVNNPDFLTVSRVEIMSASEKDEGLSVKLRRNKALTIENYETDPEKTL